MLLYRLLGQSPRIPRQVNSYAFDSSNRDNVATPFGDFFIATMPLIVVGGEYSLIAYAYGNYLTYFGGWVLIT